MIKNFFVCFFRFGKIMERRSIEDVLVGHPAQTKSSNPIESFE